MDNGLVLGQDNYCNSLVLGQDNYPELTIQVLPDELIRLINLSIDDSMSLQHWPVVCSRFHRLRGQPKFVNHVATYYWRQQDRNQILRCCPLRFVNRLLPFDELEKTYYLAINPYVDDAFARLHEIRSQNDAVSMEYILSVPNILDDANRNLMMRLRDEHLVGIPQQNICCLCGHYISKEVAIKHGANPSDFDSVREIVEGRRMYSAVYRDENDLKFNPMYPLRINELLEEGVTQDDWEYICRTDLCILPKYILKYGKSDFARFTPLIRTIDDLCIDGGGCSELLNYNYLYDASLPKHIISAAGPNFGWNFQYLSNCDITDEFYELCPDADWNYSYLASISYSCTRRHPEKPWYRYKVTFDDWCSHEHLKVADVIRLSGFNVFRYEEICKQRMDKERQITLEKLLKCREQIIDKHKSSSILFVNDITDNKLNDKK